MELRKRKAPAVPAPPPQKRTTSKKAATKNDAASVPADGPSILAGAGPVAGLGAGLGAGNTTTDTIDPTQAGAQESAVPPTEDASATARPADASIGAAEQSIPAVETTGSEALASTTSSLTDAVMASDTTIAPPPQTLSDSIPVPSTATSLEPAGTDHAMTGTTPFEGFAGLAGAARSDNLPEEPKDSTSKSGPPKVGDRVDVSTFGGSMTLEDGTSTNLAEMLMKSKKGVIFFSYPKASTPGCTKQACLFRDHHSTFTSPSSSDSSSTAPTPSYSIYGLSRDSARANSTFRAKQNLPYNLICDTSGTLLKALGLAKGDKSATRAVVVISGDGKVICRVEGGPDATVEAVKEMLGRVEVQGENVEDAVMAVGDSGL